MKMKSNNMFRDQVNSVTTWFGSWSTCEQTVVLYSLLKLIPPRHCRFLVQMLQQRITDDKDVEIQEDEANDPGYICNLQQEPKEKAIQELLIHLPLLHSGNAQAKNEYLNLIPHILSHSIENGVFIEESRQLLSYSLIHPAITCEERSKFNMWLGHLDERFSNSQFHSPSQQTQGQPDDIQGQVPFSHQPESGNSLRTNVTLTKTNSIGNAQINGWNSSVFQSSESLNLNGLDGHGQTGSHLNIHGNGRHQAGQHLQTSVSGISGHMPLQATLSAPPNFNTIMPPTSLTFSQQNQAVPAQPATHHAPLRRMHSCAPPNSLPINNSSVSEWLKSNDAHLMHGPGRPGSVLSDHAPLSPQSSTASSGSGSDEHREDGPHPVRNTFMEEGSGMRDVPLWLKSLRLHKYAYLFQQMTYEEMMSINEDWLTHQNVTKGARNKIVLSIKKLQERQDVLRNLERDITEAGSIKSCITEMRLMLNTPLKAFHKVDTDTPASLNSPGSAGDADNTIQEGDIPGQFTRLMTKVFTQLMLTSPYDDEGLNMYLQLIDKCINHEAFSQKQKRLLDSFKQQARKIWQPAPVKYSYDKKPRPNWGNTFPMGNTFNSRPIQRMGVKTSPKPPVQQQQQGGMQWSFGAKRSLVGGTNSTGHLQLQRNNSHNTAVFSRPGIVEQTIKQPVTRTQSAPLRSHGALYGGIPMTESQATDTEINARLDSLCRSVTECALAGSDGNERGSAY
ncbi:protein Smaug homolog 1-like isoform X2 [Ruditapes philippinarum]|uniref:protein Smaug homolog 1-like isoform X2 n=1 Tax=Ruditapes philippinarum TaxID=129788 RepID=UPI00295A9F7A|nr:protein Smaug homolog 1-like isoform X2 [Ruditapes philippinarum]